MLKIEILEALKEKGIEVTKTEGQTRTTCPKCSAERIKHWDKCLSVNVDEGVWLCWHCGWKGSVKADIRKKSVEEYVRPQIDISKLQLPVKIINWFQKRGISPTTLYENKIKFGIFKRQKKNVEAIVFPYYKDGVVVNCKYRTLDKQFWQQAGAEKCLYRYDEIAKVNGSILIITEGEMDCLACYEVGFRMVTSVPDGAPNANAKELHKKFEFLLSAENIINSYERIIICGDNDANGRKLTKELARRIGIEKCYYIEYPKNCKDCNDILVKYGARKLREVIFQAKPWPVDGIFSIADCTQAVITLYEEGVTRGMSTGWPALDKYFTVHPGQLTVITGIPGSGKSSFLDSLLVNLVKQYQIPCALFSPENWPLERHIQTILEKYTERPFAQDGYEVKRLTKQEILKAIKELKEYFYFIMPEDDLLTVDVILERAKVLLYRHGIKILVIDPWNEIEHNYKGMTEAQYLSQQLTKIRRWARQTGVHVFIVAHPRNLEKDKKTGDYKPPTMYDISGGANWRNKADNGLCVHRPDIKQPKTLIIIQKIRFKEVGKLGELEFFYSQECGKYFT